LISPRDFFGSSSFYDLILRDHSHLLPQIPGDASPFSQETLGKVPHGTTVLALKIKEGVIMAGDRMATEGYQISDRRIEKVYKTDDFSAIAIAGAAGPCIELARLFQTELEHYEKLEGTPLSTEGKANKLGQMVKANLPLAMQGLMVVPIFSGYDGLKDEGRIFKYDVTGGRYEEIDYYATGSGGKDARSTMKKIFKKNMNQEKGIRLALEALYDASQEDIGTGGPDLVRGIYPTVKIMTRKGISDIDTSRIKNIYHEMINQNQGE
jgi:proteasome beta subunit